MIDIKDKIAKLLALADSPNENEAKVALLKARELMAKHKLRPEEIKRAEKENVIKKNIDITCTKMTNTWATTLSSIIAEHYCCKAFRTHRHGDKKVTIGFVGLEDDFEVCVQIYRYAFDCVESRCKAIKSEYKGIYTAAYIRQITNAYGIGFCSGIRDAFAEQEKEHEQEWGFVLVTPQAVVDVMKDMGKPSSYGEINCSGHKARFAREGYEDGQKFDPSTKLAPPKQKDVPKLN